VIPKIMLSVLYVQHATNTLWSASRNTDHYYPDEFDINMEMGLLAVYC